MFFRNKRAQVALFIIIAVILSVSIILFFSLNKSVKEPAGFGLVVTSTQEYVGSCFENSADDALALVGIQGGYISLPGKSLLRNESEIAYWYYLGYDNKPTKVEIESQLNGYIRTSLALCDVQQFKDFEIKEGSVDVNSKISEDKVDFSLNWPITITKGETSYRLSKTYKHTVRVRLGEIYDTAAGIVQKEIAEPDNFNVGYLLSGEMNTEILPQDNNTVITYVIKDPKSKIDNEPYVFMFANKFK